MKVIRRPEAFAAAMESERLRGRTLGFVPTMGALHEGHLSLVRTARRENDRVAVSIFVNPMQFGPSEDFRRYPRPAARDRRLLEQEKVSYLFMPSPQAFYPGGFQTTVEPGPLAEGLCGRFRPGHFRGVTTVVAKLFHLAKPHRAYFGAKDYQQARVIERMVIDLGFDLQMRIMPTLRESDGLAMSSRNVYLDADGRRRALALFESFKLARDLIRRKVTDPRRLRAKVAAFLSKHVDKVQYAEFVDPETLETLKAAQPRMLLALACYVGKTRLIDNAIISVPRGK